MNSFESKAFINSFSKKDFIKMFPLEYKLNPQFNEFLVFINHKDMVFAFISSLGNKSDFKTRPIEELRKLVTNDHEIHVSLLDHFLFNKSSKFPYEVYSKISGLVVMFITSLCDIGVFDIEEIVYRRRCIELNDAFFRSQTEPLVAYKTLLSEFDINPDSLLELQIKNLKSETITV